MLSTLQTFLRRLYAPSPRLRAGLLALAGCGGLALGACSAVLDFTECREDADCADFFTADKKPMRCDEDLQCVARTKCTSNSQCVGLGEDYICNLTGSCAATSSDQCAAPIYPNGEASDKVVFIGSIVSKAGADKALGEAAEKAMIQALDDFQAGGGVLKSGSDTQSVGLIPCDSGGSVVQATAAARHLGEALTVPAILGPLDDDELVNVAQDVSIANGVLAYTNSPTATADLGFDDKGLVWQTNTSAVIQGRSFGYHIAYEIANGTFTNPAPEATLLFAQDEYGYGMYYALATEVQEGQPNRIPEVNGQVVSSYSNVDTGKLRIDSFGDKDILILFGGAEVAELLTHYKASGKPLPTRIYVAERSFAAVLALADVDLVDRVRLIRPDLETDNLKALRARLKDNAAPAEAGLAYDAAMVTLLAMTAHTGSEPITGVAIRSAMSRLSDPMGTPVSFGDAPATFVKAAVTALQTGKNINIEGISGPLDYDQKAGTICGNMIAYGLDPTGKSLVPRDKFTPGCPKSVVGDWVPVP